MDETQSKTSVKANGETIKRLRKAKGWTLKELAKVAKCSERTIRNAEHSEQMQMFTLRKIAEALKVDYQSLVVGAQPEPEMVSATSSRLVPVPSAVTITIAVPYEVFVSSNQLERFMELLISRIGGPDIEVKGVFRSSTKIVVKMTKAQIVRLVNAYVSNQLDDMKVISLQAWFPTNSSTKIPTRCLRFARVDGDKVVTYCLFNGDKAAWTVFANQGRTLAEALAEINALKNPNKETF